jgi:site-specific recombinase XerD
MILCGYYAGVRDEDFDWLVQHGLADEKLASLARIEFHKFAIADDLAHQDDVEELEHDRIKLVNALIQSLTFRELSKLYKTNSDRYSLMKTFSTWQSIKNYRDGGVFMDVSSSYTCVYAMLMM